MEENMGTGIGARLCAGSSSQDRSHAGWQRWPQSPARFGVDTACKIASLLLVVAVASCSRASIDGERASRNQQTPDTREQSAIRSDMGPLAVIAHLEGSILRSRGTETKKVLATIGEWIFDRDTIEAKAESFCDLQFGRECLVRINENTQFVVSRQLRRDLNGRADRRTLSVVCGSMLCKVKKITGDSDYRFETETAIIGVRGTEFSVTCIEGVGTHIAVRRGAVAVTPKVSAALVLDGADTSFAEVLASYDVRLQSGRHDFLIVNENEEILIDDSILQRASEVYSAQLALLSSISSGRMGDGEAGSMPQDDQRITQDELSASVKPVIVAKSVSVEFPGYLGKVRRSFSATLRARSWAEEPTELTVRAIEVGGVNVLRKPVHMALLPHVDTDIQIEVAVPRGLSDGIHELDVVIVDCEVSNSELKVSPLRGSLSFYVGAGDPPRSDANEHGSHGAAERHADSLSLDQGDKAPEDRKQVELSGKAIKEINKEIARIDAMVIDAPKPISPQARSSLTLLDELDFYEMEPQR